jgi:hypothetical protein
MLVRFEELTDNQWKLLVPSIKDPSMLELREQVVDFPYDMISSVKLDKGVFSCNVMFTSAGLRNSGRRGMIKKLAGIEYNVGEEAAVITAIPKDKAEELLEVIRNGIHMQREVYYQPQMRRQHTQVDMTTKNHDQQ